MDCNEITNHVLSIKEKKKLLDGFIDERDVESGLRIKEEIVNLFNNELFECFDFYSSQEIYNKRKKRIIKKIEQGIELNKKEIVFLYDIDLKARLNSFENTPVLRWMIRDKRNIKADISRATGFKPEEISTTKEEALSGHIKYHYGGLDLRDIRIADGLVLPLTISGSLNLHNVRSAQGLVLPQIVGRSLYLSCLRSANYLALPQTVGGSVDLLNLRTAEGFIFPQIIGDSLRLYKLLSIDGLDLSHTKVKVVTIGNELDSNKIRELFPHIEFKCND